MAKIIVGVEDFDRSIAAVAGFDAEPLAVEAAGPIWKTIVEIADRHDQQGAGLAPPDGPSASGATIDRPRPYPAP